MIIDMLFFQMHVTIQNYNIFSCNILNNNLAASMEFSRRFQEEHFPDCKLNDTYIRENVHALFIHLIAMYKISDRFY